MLDVLVFVFYSMLQYSFFLKKIFDRWLIVLRLHSAHRELGPSGENCFTHFIPDRQGRNLFISCSGENRRISNAENPPNCAGGIRENYCAVRQSFLSLPTKYISPVNTALVLFSWSSTICKNFSCIEQNFWKDYFRHKRLNVLQLEIGNKISSRIQWLFSKEGLEQPYTNHIPIHKCAGGEGHLLKDWKIPVDTRFMVSKDNRAQGPPHTTNIGGRKAQFSQFTMI